MVRFSSKDGTIEPFVPAEDDVRYADTNYCEAEPGQTVMLCGSQRDKGLYGVERASGEVLWSYDKRTSEAMNGTTQYHGYVYGRSGVFDLETGEIVGPDTRLGQIERPGAEAYEKRPIMVNEYGAVGRLEPEQHAWVPASG